MEKTNQFRIRKISFILLANFLFSFVFILPFGWLSGKLPAYDYLPLIAGFLIQSFIAYSVLKRFGASMVASIFLTIIVTLAGWIVSIFIMMRYSEIGC